MKIETLFIMLSCSISSSRICTAFTPSRIHPNRLLVRMRSRGGKGKDGGNKKEPNIYAKTILLPQTTFSQRANAIQREPELQSYWEENDLYTELSSRDGTTWNLHDGPPYANGELHMGHALNKILKDFVNRFKILDGFRVPYVPGWDCHGLPIELKVLQNMKSKERRGLTTTGLRAKATEFALETVKKQSDAFRRYGIYGNFEKPYLTLGKEFESQQIKVFGEMYKKGYIFRGRKPVHWSPSSRTALAEAELEYPEEHISKSIYVGFDVVQASEKLEEWKDGLRVAIWTTTPWTIPANLAVAINPDLEYGVVEHENTGRLLVAKDLVQTLEQKLLKEDQHFHTLTTLPGSHLIGTTYRHPLYSRTSPVLEGGDYITTESGTGLVHTAPGHGQEDYLTGLKYGLELLSPVDDAGRFTVEAGERFDGLNVLGEGNTEVITALNETGGLLRVEDYSHKYPYDWRTKKPTIFRATDQWFASVDGFREGAMDAIDKVQWVPEIGKNRITSFVSTRGDWCISRQRSWGVPIPVFYDKRTQEPLLDEHTLNHIADLFAEYGTDAWFTMDNEQLLPEIYKDKAEKLTKGTDTMDVWFDSGSSWAGVTLARDDLTYPADMYLEGSDQHRGWFQSSLLTSVAARNQPPYKSVLTHGFVLDEKGYKMSKSLGNVVDPQSIINGGNNKKKNPAYGADVLRLWVASVDYSTDVCIGDSIIKQTFETYRKFRNTARYLLGNLNDFDPDTHSVPYKDLPSMDKWMLGRLSSTLNEVHDAFSQYQFQRAIQELLRFSSSDLSNFYLDVSKDRLYISSKNDVVRRRSCQTVLHKLLKGFALAVAPILPHMAEDIWQNLPFEKETSSVFEQSWPEELTKYPDHDSRTWILIRNLRDDVNKQMESARNDKLIGASLDAAAYIYIPKEKEEDRKILNSMQHDDDLISPSELTNGVDDLRTALMLSQVNLVDSADIVRESCDERHVIDEALETGYTIGVKKTSGNKCARCWFYDNRVGKHGLLYEDLCQRCNEAVKIWEKETGDAVSEKEEVVKN